jgi:hypothetical protein
MNGKNRISHQLMDLFALVTDSLRHLSGNPTYRDLQWVALFTWEIDIRRFSLSLRYYFQRWVR